MTSRTAATRYARALFDVAQKEADIQQVGRELASFAALFAGNGFHSKEWWAEGQGREMTLGKVLEPVADFREKLLFIKGQATVPGEGRKAE